MLLENIDLQNENIRKSLLLKDDFESSWLTYKAQYMAALDLLFGIANEKKYQMNSLAMPFLFMFRHTIELLLKEECTQRKVDVPKVHELDRIANSLTGKAYMKAQTEVLNWDTQGDEFRYNVWGEWQKNGYGDLLDVYSASSYISSEEKMNNIIKKGDDMLHNELTFHLSDVIYLGHVRTQYDLCVTKLLNSVVNDESKIDDIFLPIMFCVRHSVELALKSSLLELCEKQEATMENIRHTHSLESLFNELDKYLKIAIDKIPKSDFLYKETTEKRILWNTLRARIQQLDSKSLAFRFPCDRLSLVDRDLVVQTLEMYQNVDSYLTFCVSVLKNSGYIDGFEIDLN